MKKFINTMAVCLAMVSMAACSSNDEPALSGADSVAGSYTGNTEVSAMGMTLDPVNDAVIVIKAVSEGTVSVTVPASTFNSYEIPAITFEEVAVSETTTEGSYTLRETSLTTESYECSLSGSVSGNSATISYSVKPGKMPMPIRYSFSGTKK